MTLKLNRTNNIHTVNSEFNYYQGAHIIFLGRLHQEELSDVLVHNCCCSKPQLLYGWLPNPWPYTGRNFFMTQTFGGNPINIFLHSHMISPAQMLSRKGNQYWFLSSTRVGIEKKLYSDCRTGQVHSFFITIVQDFFEFRASNVQMILQQRTQKDNILQ